MSRSSRKDKWPSHWSIADAEEVLAEWEGSGLSLAEFSRQRGIKVKRLYWWRTRLRQWKAERDTASIRGGHQAEESTLHLIEAEISGDTHASAILAVSLENGDRVEVSAPERIDVLWLVQLVRGIRGEVGR